MKLTLEAVAALTGGKILSGDPELTVFGVASLLDASHEEASFLGNEKYFEDFLHTSAGIVLVPPALPAYPENVAFVEVDNPSMAFNALVKYFMASAYRFTPGIHPTADSGCRTAAAAELAGARAGPLRQEELLINLYPN